MIKIIRNWKSLSEEQQDKVMDSIFNSWWYAAFLIVMNVIGIGYIISMVVTAYKEFTC